MSANKMQRRLRFASGLVLLGLLIELFSLSWSHPTAFILFLGPGALLMVVGILFYLYSLVAVSEPGVESRNDNIP